MWRCAGEPYSSAWQFRGSSRRWRGCLSMLTGSYFLCCLLWRRTYPRLNGRIESKDQSKSDPGMDDASANVDRIRQAFNRERLLDRLTRLIAVPSPTGQAGSVADCLAEILTQDSFSVERVAAGHPVAPAVVVRLEALGGSSGRTLQFDGHLDTVHLPFVPPAVDGDRLTGSGAADMKSGIAAAVEAMCILRDTDSLRSGSLLFTAHDLHEAPWGFGQQLDAMIAQGYVGNAVLIPEPLSDRLPVIGRGCAVWKAGIHRPSPPIHEVMRPMDEGSVILAGSKTALRLDQLNQALSARTDPLAGSDS